ncbi:MAG: hypothetical protein GF384_00250, partial [Elusimicrobia bacterium]|nr:hypothetical protein [Elusimicrobiota bacterium]
MKKTIALVVTITHFYVSIGGATWGNIIIGGDTVERTKERKEFFNKVEELQKRQEKKNALIDRLNKRE